MLIWNGKTKKWLVIYRVAIQNIKIRAMVSGKGYGEITYGYNKCKEFHVLLKIKPACYPA